MAKLVCASPTCDETFEPTRSDHVYCSTTCRVRTNRSASKGSGGEGPVALATRAELESMDRLESTEGAVAVALAGLLDEQKGAMGAAGTADRLLKIMDEIRKRQPTAKTPLDLMRERRARRGA